LQKEEEDESWRPNEIPFDTPHCIPGEFFFWTLGIGIGKMIRIDRKVRLKPGLIKDAVIRITPKKCPDNDDWPITHPGPLEKCIQWKKKKPTFTVSMVNW
jgi:hypothetical protein